MRHCDPPAVPQSNTVADTSRNTPTPCTRGPTDRPRDPTPMPTPASDDTDEQDVPDEDTRLDGGMQDWSLAVTFAHVGRASSTSRRPAPGRSPPPPPSRDACAVPTRAPPHIPRSRPTGATGATTARQAYAPRRAVPSVHGGSCVGSRSIRWRGIQRRGFGTTRVGRRSLTGRVGESGVEGRYKGKGR